MDDVTKQIDEALDSLRPGLDADGFELSLEDVATDGAVHVGLMFTPDACMECLVPDELMVQMLEEAIRGTYPEMSHVVLKKYNM